MKALVLIASAPLLVLAVACSDKAEDVSETTPTNTRARTPKPRSTVGPTADIGDLFATLAPRRTLAPLPTLPPVDPQPVEPAPAGQVVVDTCINGAFNGWSGETVFELCNGEVWIQSGFGFWFHFAFRPNVLIVDTGGAHEMFVDGESESVLVRRVTDFTRTCIDGDFEGWSGDTVFVLCNGQVWQQSSYDYWYRYAYRPEVLIYDAGGGYRLKLVDEEETISVVRLE